MENNLLTICIPTYNRAKKLDYSLSCFERELKQVDSSLLELFISDNCSSDNTPEVVEKYIQKGLPITYSRNDENIGPDNNFLKCFYAAQSKYLWLLGDDDFLLEGRLKTIVEVLVKSDIGCLNLASNYSRKGVHFFDDNQSFATIVGHWLTFMSANIIRTDTIAQTQVTEELRRSNLLQMPFFIDAILSHPSNVLIKDRIFEKDSAEDNGGYNFFNVFVRNYLDIWKSYRERDQIKWFTYWTLKRCLLWNFVMPFITYFHFQNRYQNMDRKNEWKTFWEHYWYEPYAYVYFLKIPYVLYKSKVQK